ncbi:cytochrome c(L), periplasmic [Hyphomicrobium sp. D-2]|uniref:cytochrome c(L), periplasmic n=1 Tax=Hyphomicrobium sp. D-2 TaxID=3041621 RepID=UPI0032AE8A6D
MALDPFRNTITGDILDLNIAPKDDPEPPAVKQFLETGVNPYNEKAECLPLGNFLYLSSCSGCHGHVAEGKVGHGLNDAYWTYPKNRTDKGLFETIYGGAQGMMGPHSDKSINEILNIMAWIRHLYAEDPKKARWLTPEQREVFKPYVEDKSVEHGTAELAQAVPADVCGTMRH